MPRAHHDTHQALVGAILASPYPLPNQYHLPAHVTHHDGHRGRSQHLHHQSSAARQGRPHRQPVHVGGLDLVRLVRDGYPVIVNLNYCPCTGSRHRHRASTPSASSSFDSGLSGDADDETQPVLRTPETSHHVRRYVRSPHPVVKQEVDSSISDRVPEYRSSSPESSVSSERTVKAPPHKLGPSVSVVAEASPIDATFQQTTHASRRNMPLRRRVKDRERPIEGMCGFDIERWRHSAATSVGGPSTLPPPYSSPAFANATPAPEVLRTEAAQPFVPPPLATASTVYMDICPTAAQTVYMDVSTPQPPQVPSMRPPSSSGWPMSIPNDVPMLSRRTTSQPARSPTPMDWQPGNESDPGLAQPAPFSEVAHTRSQRPSLPTDLRYSAQIQRRKRAARKRKALQSHESTMALERQVGDLIRQTGQREMDERMAPAVALSAAIALRRRASAGSPPPTTRKRRRSSKKGSIQTQRSITRPAALQVAEPVLSVPMVKRIGVFQEVDPAPASVTQPQSRGKFMVKRIAELQQVAQPQARGKRKRSPDLPTASASASTPTQSQQHRPKRPLPMSDLAAFNAALRLANQGEEEERLKWVELEFEELFANGFGLGEEEREIGRAQSPGQVVEALVKETLDEEVSVERGAKRLAAESHAK